MNMINQDGEIAEAYRKAAKELHLSEGTLEIDSNAIVSQSDDGGAYVQAWVWVDDDEAELCRTCRQPYDGCGDGYDGNALSAQTRRRRRGMTKADVENKIKEMWPGLGSLSICKYDTAWDIDMGNMYEAPGLSLSQLIELSKFFGTENIKSGTGYSQGGCETCDYGSSYSITLEVRLNAKTSGT